MKKEIFNYNEGDKYERDFKNNKSDEKGICYYKNGDGYEAGYKNHKKKDKVCCIIKIEIEKLEIIPKEDLLENILFLLFGEIHI